MEKEQYLQISALHKRKEPPLGGSLPKWQSVPLLVHHTDSSQYEHRQL